MLKQIWKRSLIKTLKKTISNQLLYNTLPTLNNEYIYQFMNEIINVNE